MIKFIEYYRDFIDPIISLIATIITIASFCISLKIKKIIGNTKENQQFKIESQKYKKDIESMIIQVNDKIKENQELSDVFCQNIERFIVQIKEFFSDFSKKNKKVLSEIEQCVSNKNKRELVRQLDLLKIKIEKEEIYN